MSWLPTKIYQDERGAGEEDNLNQSNSHTWIVKHLSCSPPQGICFSVWVLSRKASDGIGELCNFDSCSCPLTGEAYQGQLLSILGEVTPNYTGNGYLVNLASLETIRSAGTRNPCFHLVTRLLIHPWWVWYNGRMGVFSSKKPVSMCKSETSLTKGAVCGLWPLTLPPSSKMFFSFKCMLASHMILQLDWSYKGLFLVTALRGDSLGTLHLLPWIPYYYEKKIQNETELLLLPNTYIPLWKLAPGGKQKSF